MEIFYAMLSYMFYSQYFTECGGNLPCKVKLYVFHNVTVCGDNLPYNSAGGQISSPGFSSGANYAARMQCIWVINNRVQSSSSIAMRFSSFSVEMQGQCFYDHVEIREGKTIIQKILEGSVSIAMWKSGQIR